MLHREDLELHREDLEQANCGHKDCSCAEGPLWIHGKCHPDSDLRAFYNDGAIHFSCADCSQPIVAVAVAARKYDA